MEEVEYFGTAGDWTDIVLDRCKKYAEENKIRDIIIASTTGATGVKASKLFKGYNLVVVTHAAGFKEFGKTELIENNRINIEKGGGKILVASHALSGIERSFRKKFNTIGPLELIANAFKIFGQGTKVCVEIALMTADAGLLASDTDVICIGGTGHGSDTALLIRPVNSGDFFDLKVRKILCKPTDF
jgi:hypothetical protein